MNVSTPAVDAEKIRISHYPSVAALPTLAQRLLSDQALRNPFVSLEWLQCFERHLVRPHERIFYLVAASEDETRCVLPLILERLRWPGATKLRSLSNFYTGIFEVSGSERVLTDSEVLRSFASAFAEYLSVEFFQCPLIECSPVRDRYGLLGQVFEALGSQGYATRSFFAHGNWYEDTRGLDYPSYLAARPGRVRSTLARQHRKLLRDRGYSVDIGDTAEALGNLFPAYEMIYRASWKTAERSPLFIREVMMALAARGLVRLGVLTVSGVPAAAQLWIKAAKVWCVFKLAYDPEFVRYSVGSLLTARMVEHFFAEDEFDGIDFLSGDDPYKKEWVYQRREHLGLEAINRKSLLGLLLLAKRVVSGVSMEQGSGRRGRLRRGVAAASRNSWWRQGKQAGQAALGTIGTLL